MQFETVIFLRCKLYRSVPRGNCETKTASCVDHNYYLVTAVATDLWLTAFYLFVRYLDTCPKNDVILFSRKGFSALGLELEEIRFRSNVHSGKCPISICSISNSPSLVKGDKVTVALNNLRRSFIWPHAIFKIRTTTRTEIYQLDWVCWERYLNNLRIWTLYRKMKSFRQSEIVIVL